MAWSKYSDSDNQNTFYFLYIYSYIICKWKIKQLKDNINRLHIGKKINIVHIIISHLDAVDSSLILLSSV